MTDDELAAIETRANAATPAPWRVDDESWKEVNDITVWCGPEGDEAMCVCNMGAPIAAIGDREEAEVSFANGTFVAHARTDVPALVAEVRRLRAERDAAVERGRCAEEVAEAAGRYLDFPSDKADRLLQVAVISYRRAVRAPAPAEGNTDNLTPPRAPAADPRHLPRV